MSGGVGSRSKKQHCVVRRDTSEGLRTMGRRSEFLLKVSGRLWEASQVRGQPGDLCFDHSCASVELPEVFGNRLGQFWEARSKTGLLQFWLPGDIQGLTPSYVVSRQSCRCQA